MTPRLEIAKRRRRMVRAGWSRTELVAGLLIIAVAFAVGVPGLLQMRESARRATCLARFGTVALALRAYHDTHRSFPPAAIWARGENGTLALHKSKRLDRFVRANWAMLLLPHLGNGELLRGADFDRPIAAEKNAVLRESSIDVFTCPSDEFNRRDNPYQLRTLRGQTIPFARGNLGINGGTNSIYTDAGSTSTPTGDHAHVTIDPASKRFEFFGNGVAGFNRAFRLDEFHNGQSTLVLLDEIRAGVDAVDPRGTWALGHIASSVTWGHGVNGDAYGPNNPWARSDDIMGGPELNERIGPEELIRLGMPCVSYLDENQNATARSRHPGGVHVAFVDGHGYFVVDQIDPALWQVLHSRETPPGVLANAVPAKLAWAGCDEDARTPAPSEQTPAAEGGFSNSIGMEFTSLPVGEFMMGLPDRGRDGDIPPESPPHRVRFDHPVVMARREVTQDQYERVIGTNPSHHVKAVVGESWTSQFPVESVTWEEAVAFCEKLSDLPDEKAAGRRYRLPTEAEWEYGCRAGARTPYAMPTALAEKPLEGDAAGLRSNVPVSETGRWKPNGFGLYDMRGNVWEWCADWFDRDYYSRSPLTSPKGPPSGYLKVVRGGDWIYVGEGCFINYPILAPWKSSPFIGFRVVCEQTR